MSVLGKFAFSSASASASAQLCASCGIRIETELSLRTPHSLSPFIIAVPHSPTRRPPLTDIYPADRLLSTECTDAPVAFSRTVCRSSLLTV